MTIEVKQLAESILEDELKFVNFFNGRLLSGEDLSREQLSNREARRLLGKAIGDSVAYGVEVARSPKGDQKQPMLRVTKGVAINREGHVLCLKEDVDLLLVRTAPVPPAGRNVKFFDACKPLQTGVYVSAGEGVYLLTIAPAVTNQGRAPVSGLGNIEAACNTRYIVEGVQFRLIPVPLTAAEISDRNHLRNLVAYKCFGVQVLKPFEDIPFGPKKEGYGLIDDLREKKFLTDCDVPLAMIYWTTAGIQFIDMWSARRRLAKPSAVSDWSYVVSDRRRAESEAMFAQFQDQVTSLRTRAGDIGTATAASHFLHLPSIGVIPVNREQDSTDAEATKFFTGMTYRGPAFINVARLEALVRESLTYPPIDVDSRELVWLYRVRENMIDAKAQNYVVFSNGHMPYLGDAQFDLVYWNYGNYALAR
jgi:hypothetical protein